MNKQVPEQFNPSWYSVFFNAFYIIRSRLFRAIEKNSSYIQGHVLDFGCGSKPYESLFKVDSYTGLDYATEVSDKNRNMAADVFYDGKIIPFGNAHFDSVFSTEVVEHVFNVNEILPEIHRVLKPGGIFMFTCPFSWPEHEQPYDYARYTSFALKDMMRIHGFEVINYEKTGSYLETIMQLTVLYIYFFIPQRPRVLNIIFFTVFISPFMLLGLALAKILPGRIKRADLYLNNVMVARRK